VRDLEEGTFKVTSRLRFTAVAVTTASTVISTVEASATGKTAVSRVDGEAAQSQLLESDHTPLTDEVQVQVS
jgi:hypothetical protein